MATVVRLRANHRLKSKSKNGQIRTYHGGKNNYYRFLIRNLNTWKLGLSLGFRPILRPEPELVRLGLSMVETTDYLFPRQILDILKLGINLELSPNLAILGMV